MASVEGFTFRGLGAKASGPATENWNCPERCLHGAQCEREGEHEYHSTTHCPEFGTTNFRGGLYVAVERTKEAPGQDPQIGQGLASTLPANLARRVQDRS